MTNQNPYLQEVFLQPPLVSFKRQKNLRDKLVRAKVSKDIKMKPKRYLKGMKKCGFQCTACPYINETKEIYSSTWKWNITKDVDCATSNCKQKYIGETDRELRERISKHRGYIHKKI